MGNSDANTKKELDKLLAKTRQATRTTDRKTRPQPVSVGLKPSDILFLPENETLLANYLSRQGNAQLKDIQQVVTLSQAEILRTLSSLKDKGYINASLKNGEMYYHIKFADKINFRQKTNLPHELWKSLRRDDVEFLKEISLFNKINESDLSFIIENTSFEHYERNDVLFWQGEPTRAFFIIERGVVAVSHILSDGSSKLLTYLEQGEFFGEGGLLTGRTSTATITAFTPLDVLVIPKDKFYDLMARNSSIAIELSRVLAHRLAATNARLASERGASKLLLVISNCQKCGATTVASAMALALSSSGQTNNAYIEFPQHELSSVFNFSPELDSYTHPGGFEVINSNLNVELPQAAQVALIIDQAASRYNNIVACVPWEFAEQIDYLLGNATQVVLIAPPQPEALTKISRILPHIRAKVPSNKTRIFTVLNRASLEHPDCLSNAEADFQLPFMDNLPPPSNRVLGDLPTPLREAVSQILDMLGFTSQVGIYIPTTIDVDQHMNTTEYIDKTLAFMGGMFGGATHEKVRGVWNSEEAGIVAEDIHLVRSFCSPTSLDANMSSVVDFMEMLKDELKQEAMALEINGKLILI